MSANQVGLDSEMIGSKFSMNLRKKVIPKAVLQENRNNDTSTEKLASIKKRKVESKILKFSSDKNGVLTETSENNKSVNLPTVNTSFTFDQSSDKTSSEISGVKKQHSSLIRPKRGLKTLKESSKENVNLELVPPKARKRKRDNEQNNGKVKNVDTNNEDTAAKQGLVSSFNIEVITSKFTVEKNDFSIKNSDFINSCNDETDASIEKVEKNVEPSTVVGSESLKKPNTRSAKGMLNKKFKDDDKSVDIGINSNTSKSPSVHRSVRIQANKSNVVKSVQKSTKSKLNRGNSAGNETKAGLAKDVKSPKQKIVVKTLVSKKERKSEGKISNYFNAAVLNQNKESKTIVISKDHIPIYKKHDQPSEAKKAKKYSRISDVYNIEFDEDMKNSPVIIKKKSEKAPKKSKNIKSKVVASKSQFRGTKKDKTSITSSVKLTPVMTGDHENNPASDFHQDSDNDMDVDPGILDSEHLTDEPSSHSPVLNKDVQKKTSSNEHHAVSSFTVVSTQEKLRNPTSQTPEKQINVDAKFALISSSPAPIEKELTSLISGASAQDSSKKDNESQNMMTFLSDFEASFLRPHLTSTPDNTDQNLPFKRPMITKRHPAVRMLEISSIPPIKPVQEPCFVSDLEFESPEKIDVSNITLFESPSKTETEKMKETKHQKKAGKKCQTKLNFGKSCKAAQKNETEKISPHCVSGPETEEVPGEKPHPSQSSAPKRVLREKKKIVLQEFELSEDESEFEDDFFNSEAESEDAGSENKSNDLPSSPVKYIEVMKPRVSYSPSVKPCFSRTKKATLPVKEYSAKEEKLIQSMNEHFSELDSLELCIE